VRACTSRGVLRVRWKQRAPGGAPASAALARVTDSGRFAQVDASSKAPSVLFDYPELLKCPVDGLAWAISERPQEAIPCLGIAVYEALFVDRTGRADPATLLHMPDRRVGVRFANYEPVTPMKYLKSQCIGKFVSVKGTVIRVSTIKPILVEMKFLCNKCGFETLQRMTEGKFEAPVQCESVSCVVPFPGIPSSLFPLCFR
jgi:DNA helicase MCM8